MRGFFAGVLAGLLSWWGLWLIAAFDSSMVFFLPLGVDIGVIALVSGQRDLFWLYPTIASAGSLCGAAVTYYIGRRLGHAGLERYVSEDRLDRFRRRIEEKGAVALAVMDLIPPPFPFTACVLVAGALEVNTWLFFVTLGLTRMVRFGGEAVLAYFYGRQIIHWLRSDVVEYFGIFMLVTAIVGTAIGVIQIVRKEHTHRRKKARCRAA